jgi:hypothetical protein
VQGAAHGSSPYQIAPVSQNAKIIVGCCLAVIGDDEYVMFFNSIMLCYRCFLVALVSLHARIDDFSPGFPFISESKP